MNFELGLYYFQSHRAICFSSYQTANHMFSMTLYANAHHFAFCLNTDRNNFDKDDDVWPSVWNVIK